MTKLPQRESIRESAPNDFQPQPPSSDASVRADGFDCFRIPEPQANARAREVYRLVFPIVCADRNRDRLDDVSLLALTESEKYARIPPTGTQRKFALLFFRLRHLGGDIQQKLAVFFIHLG